MLCAALPCTCTAPPVPVLFFPAGLVLGPDRSVPRPAGPAPLRPGRAHPLRSARPRAPPRPISARCGAGSAAAARRRVTGSAGRVPEVRGRAGPGRIRGVGSAARSKRDRYGGTGRERRHWAGGGRSAEGRAGTGASRWLWAAGRAGRGRGAGAGPRVPLRDLPKAGGAAAPRGAVPGRSAWGEGGARGAGGPCSTEGLGRSRRALPGARSGGRWRRSPGLTRPRVGGAYGAYGLSINGRWVRNEELGDTVPESGCSVSRHGPSTPSAPGRVRLEPRRGLCTGAEIPVLPRQHDRREQRRFPESWSESRDHRVCGEKSPRLRLFP